MKLETVIEQAIEAGPPTDEDPSTAKIVEIRRIGASGAEAAEIHFRDGSQAFAKRYLGPDASQRLRGEAAGLNALAEVLPASGTDEEFQLTVPPVLREVPSTGLLLCGWVDARSPTRNEKGLAEALVTMQRCSADLGGGSHLPGFDHETFLGDTLQDNQTTPNWPTFFVERRLRPMLALLRAVAPHRLTTSLEHLCEQAPKSLEGSSEPNVLLHGDLWSGNLLWTERGAAVVDPAASWGHREAELGMLTLFGGLGQAFYDRYQQLWPMEPGWQRRVAIYRLYHVLNHRVLFGSSYDASAMQLLEYLLR